VSQISPPVRILFIGAIVFLAAWFTVLRPKADTVEPPIPQTTTSEPVSGPGKAVDKAKEAAGTNAPAAAATTEPSAAATTTPQTAPEPQVAAAIPAEALAALPKDVAAALEARKVVVFGVFADGATAYRPMADDDRYVRNELRDVNRYDGDVLVKPVAISELSKYGALVNDLDVNQSPSVVVIDGNLQGRVLTGYVDRISINQVIADARDAGTEPDITDAYLRAANKICSQYELRLSRHSWPTINGQRARNASFDRLVALQKSYRGKVAGLPAPAEWRGLKAHWLRVMAVDERTVAAAAKAYKSGDATAFTAALSALDSRDARALDRRFDAAGVTDCAQNRRS
jgi:hypothetical protein